MLDKTPLSAWYYLLVFRSVRQPMTVRVVVLTGQPYVYGVPVPFESCTSAQLSIWGQKNVLDILGKNHTFVGYAHIHNYDGSYEKISAKIMSYSDNRYAPRREIWPVFIWFSYEEIGITKIVCAYAGHTEKRGIFKRGWLVISYYWNHRICSSSFFLFPFVLVVIYT